MTMAVVSVFAMSAKPAVATDIDKTHARKVAAYFMASQKGDKAITESSMREVWAMPNEVSGTPALYVFNTADERGFVVVSGSDCISPIVAYSTEGAFDPEDIAPAFRWWLEQVAAPIAYAQNEGLEADAEVSEEWRVLDEERLPYFGQNSKEVIKLLSTTWNQEPLYNDLCPSDDGGKSVTGCVATAMAQIIRYWEYPHVGRYTHSYKWNGQTLTVDYSSTYYDYDLMPNSLSSSSSDEEIYATAQLNYHCGVAVDMSYSSYMSGAVSQNVPPALYKYFKYEKDSMQLISRSESRFRNNNSQTAPNAKDTLWVNTIKDQIMMGRPVYYTGCDPDPSSGKDARHAFVCDGWNTSTKTLHFNWGWGGKGDTWCNAYISKLKSGSSAYAYNFTTEHNAIIGITPPKDSIQSSAAIATVENPFAREIYPNPASEQVTVSYRLTGNSSTTMQVLDATGRLVKEVRVSPAEMEVRLSVADLRPGVYFCRLQGFSKKFVVR